MSESNLTVTSLTDEILDNVHGFTRHQEQRTSLLNSIDADDLSFVCTNMAKISAGTVEIEDELVAVATVDETNSIVTIEPWGRGYGGTTATSHSANARITSAPLYPRQRVRNAIYGVLRETFPQIFSVNETLLDGSAVRTNYTMPSDCWHVLSVETKLYGSSLMWVPVPRWRQNKRLSTVELEVIGPIVVGSDRVRVQYIRTPPSTIGSTDDLTTYGYDFQVRDVIVLGATAKLLAATEPARVQVESMVAHGRAEAVPAGSATQAAKFLYQMFQKRVADEAAQLQMRYPMQPHRTR